MDRARRELLVARIASGVVRLRLGGQRQFVLRRPGREHAYAASEVYAEVLHESLSEGVFSGAELLEYLYEQGLWDEGREKLLADLPKEIEEFKVKLYKCAFKSNERKAVRECLRVAKNKLGEVLAQRHAHDHLSAEGAAAIAKARYLLACSLHTAGGERVFPDDFMDRDTSLLDEVMAAYSATRLDDADLREVARTDPWRPTWNAHKVEGRLFGVDPCDYTEEQLGLVNWSALYDSVFGHPECPADEAVNDDDLLDGWLIIQRRAREARLGQVAGEELVRNEKIRNSQEVFLVAETLEDARKVVGLNDDMGKAIQRSRFKHLKEKGRVDELDMPDTRRRLVMEATQRMTEAITGKK